MKYGNPCHQSIGYKIHSNSSLMKTVLHLEGKDNFWMPREKYFYFCKFGNKKFLPKYYDYSGYDFFTLFGIIEKGRIVTFDIPLKNFNSNIFHFYISYNDIDIEIFPSLGWFTHIPPIKGGYYISQDYIVKKVNNYLSIFNNKQTLVELFEKEYCEQLKKERKKYLINLRKKTIKYRKKINKKEIWIISDRPDKAGDNGEYFFRFLTNKNPEGILPFFAIRKNCSDYKRLKKFGNVLNLNSDEYLKIFLKADKIISSMSNSWVDNPFGEDRKYIRDLFHFDLIFLQHGIIKDDLSDQLNRLRKNYSLFITSTKKEYMSILNPKYGYNKSNIILTGLPRYDNLYRLNKTKRKEKLILIAPTWRMNIKGTTNLITYESIHSDSFKFTRYFNFYNNLINDEKLLYIMKKFNYTGIFCLHPSFSSQYIDFTKNNLFLIKNKCNYQDILLKASLLITDYSSIFFDFAYLKKPVIYAHFDYEEYRLNHYPEGYFDYEKDGFGSVSYDLKTTVDKIINEIENNCLLKEIYLRRINNFFTYFDELNNDRLYKEILKNTKLTKSLREPISYILIVLAVLINAKLIIIFKNIIIPLSDRYFQ
jgi:CDP-glycerol glycerophosphotransferase (TagB/SpsB family)